MRIVHAVVTAAFAGTERYVVDVANAQAARGHDVTVIAGQPVGDRLNAAVRWLPGDSPQRAVRSSLRVKADIGHAHLTYGEFALTSTRWRTGATCLATRHLATPRGQSAVGRSLKGVIEAGLTCELAISEFVASALPGTQTVIHSGVANARQSEAHDPPVLLLAQRLEPEKATSLAIQAFLQSQLPQAGWTMCVAGVGSQAESLRAMVGASPNAGSVRFLGLVSDMGALYAEVDAVLASAPAEPLGLTVIEAMARGLPVIAAAAGGHLESLSTAPEALFAPNDADAAADTLNLLLRPEWRREVGTRLRRAQQQFFELEQHVSRLDEIYGALHSV